MSITVYVKVPEDKKFPEAHEPIVSISWGTGGLLGMVREATGEDLTDMSPSGAADALMQVIEELDLEDDGVFHDQYWVEANQRWNGQKRSREEWAGMEGATRSMPKDNLPDYLKSYKAYTGYRGRYSAREDAFRFYCYYKIGYAVVWEND